MPADHPTPDELERFLLNRPEPGPAGGTRRVARHLLLGCAACSRQLRLLGWDDDRLDRLLIVPSPPPAATASTTEPPAPTDASEHRPRVPPRRRSVRYNYDRAFARAEQAVAEVLTRREMPDPYAAHDLDPLLAELDSASFDEQERRVLHDARLARPRLVHYLVERSRRARLRDPRRMVQQANLARLTAEACSAPAAGGARRLADLRAVAWNAYGSALHAGARWGEASRALAEAEIWRARGTGDPLLRAALLHELALLFARLGETDRATAVITQGSDLSSSSRAHGFFGRILS